jgi:hypothetical protein
MKTAFVATAILTASFCAIAQGETPVSLHEAGPIANGELGYSGGEPASTARPRSSKVTSTMGASAAAAPQEAPLTRTKARAELNEAVYKGQLGSGEFGSLPTRGSMGSQTIGQ